MSGCDGPAVFRLDLFILLSACHPSGRANTISILKLTSRNQVKVNTIRILIISKKLVCNNILFIESLGSCPAKQSYHLFTCYSMYQMFITEH